MKIVKRIVKYSKKVILIRFNIQYFTNQRDKKLMEKH